MMSHLHLHQVQVLRGTAGRVPRSGVHLHLHLHASVETKATKQSPAKRMEPFDEH
jgi:hypothetical protein